jgi:4-amino-4-deoxy-L-arabinose transferase-like glycosyltransferase
LLLAALAVRLAWVLTRPSDAATIEQLPDQREYLEVARSFLSGDGFSFTDPRFSQRVYAHRTPGYPLLIAACGANVTIVRIVQALLDVSTVLAIYLLARRWLPPDVCLFAAMLAAFNPFLVYFSGLLLTETLFTSMLAWGMLLITARKTIPWLLGGLVLALAVLVRPGAIGMPVLLGVLGAFASAPANHDPAAAYQRRWPIPVGTTMLLLTLLVLLPWAIRNHRVVGRWVWTSTNDGITRYDGFNPDSAAKDWPGRGESDQSFVRAMPQLLRMSETDRNDYLADLANQYIRERPLEAAKLAGAKVLRTWSPRPLSDAFSRPAFVAAALAYAIPFLLLFACGLVFAPLPGSVKLLLAAPAIYLTLTVALSVGSLRYRIPAEPPMAVIAAGVLAAGSTATGVASRGERPADDNAAGL